MRCWASGVGGGLTAALARLTRGRGLWVTSMTRYRGSSSPDSRIFNSNSSSREAIASKTRFIVPVMSAASPPELLRINSVTPPVARARFMARTNVSKLSKSTRQAGYATYSTYTTVGASDSASFRTMASIAFIVFHFNGSNVAPIKHLFACTSSLEQRV